MEFGDIFSLVLGGRLVRGGWANPSHPPASRPPRVHNEKLQKDGEFSESSAVVGMRYCIILIVPKELLD